MTYNPAGGKTYYLGTSIGSTNTSILLSSFVEPVSGIPYTMALLNTDIAYGTVGPRTSSSEFISFTGITQNANGSALLTGVVRGLAKKYPFTSDVAFKLPHSGQSQFILSDVPQVFKQYAGLNDNNVFSGDNIFSGDDTFSAHAPTIPTESSSEVNRAASIGYVNATAAAGTPDASTSVKGKSKLSVAPVSPTDPIAAGTNDGRIPTQGENDALVGTSGTPSSTNKYVTDADTSGTGKVMRISLFGLAIFGDGSDGNVTISSNTTLTRDMFYNNLIVNAGINLICNGFRIFVKGTLTNNGIIHTNGNNGVNGGNGGDVITNNAGGADGAVGPGGAALPFGSIFGSLAGQNGQAGQVAAINGSPVSPIVYPAPSAEPNSLTGVDGAKGGDGGLGGAFGGFNNQYIAGTVNDTVKVEYLALLMDQISARTINGVVKTAGASAGGAGGTTAGTNTGPAGLGGAGAGGGAGGNGGITLISAYIINNTATGIISSNGGNAGNGGRGGNAIPGAGGNSRNIGGGGAGGGAGGSGGAVILITTSLTNLGSIVSTGGTFGTGGIGGTGDTNGTAGTSGSVGNAGIVYQYLVS